MNPYTSDLLDEVEQALDDWIVTYAADHCEPAQVEAAWKRISEHGGTLAYVTDLRERVHSASHKRAPELKRGKPVRVQRLVRCPVELAIENAIAYYPMLFHSRTAVLHHMFVVLGCGYHWSKGELVVWLEGTERDEIPRSAAKLLAQHRTTIEHPYPWCNFCNLAKMPKNVKPQWREAAEEIRAVLEYQGYKFHEREDT